ncbi:3-ketoacyl-CoA thiolase with broad chain length specificity [Scheffersomyces spartinae]|uniref:acetyl-CoA C-acyltransferase n=1 Tax=Scheffersomyces spartinae TaxID=45513 RepID=A0A9P8AGJ9_9ASCO|nr:3-ketoacyl-CoA thiolase with broad chain length specificity [Scheffersomyces spartinae]KAG7191681.1 3-ketoacyl-CoA thiolase with broad chain length specificity [Scheffersomyces spartinae]
MNRLNQLLGQLSANKADAIRQKNPDDVVIVGAYRTAIGKGGRGSFKDTGSDYLLTQLFSAFLKKTGVDASLIEDVAVGNVLNRAAGATEHRAASLASGIPDTAAFVALNRQCSSGLMAISDIANKIKCGEIDCGLAAGVESMSLNYGPQAIPKLDPHVEENEGAKKCLIPMGITNENVAEKYNISREVQDEFAANSYAKASEAVASGKFKDEILPIEVTIAEEEEDDDGEDKVVYKKVVVDTDEGPRQGVTAAKLAKLKPAFKPTGVTHAGNASQVSDGAACVLLMRRSLAESKGYPIQGKFVLCCSVGVPPEIMGVGPAYAIPKVLQKSGLTVDDVSVFEINEAFAGQCLFSQKQCNIPDAKLNPKGGAIALGHPLGCTGARQYATILRELQPGEIGVTSMCIGTGMGAASVLVKE